MEGPGKATITHGEKGLVSLTITDENGVEHSISEGVVTWYPVETTLEDYLTGHPLKLFGHLALAESMSSKSRVETLKSIFVEDHEEVFQAYKMMIHNCLTERGFQIPGGVLASESYANEILITRPTGEKAINVVSINARFKQWIEIEIKNTPLQGFQNDVYQFLHGQGEGCARGSHVCQLVTVLFLIDGTFSGERELSGVRDRYEHIFGEIFPEELPSDLDLQYTKDEILKLCYDLRNSLKTLRTPKGIDLRFENNDNVFEIPTKQTASKELKIYAENFYSKLVTYIMEWEARNRTNPDYMPNRIEKSFDFDE